MLLDIDTETRKAKQRAKASLRIFGLDERALQDILFQSLDRLFPDDELILLRQSRRWQKEPDLMAVDKKGNLFIFELAACESHSPNLLQVLRYGQLYGAMKYPGLDAWYKKATVSSQSLKIAHKAKFGIELSEEDFNRKQVFVVITNGVNYRAREAAQYWRSTGLDVRPWVYSIYHTGFVDEMLLEMLPFRDFDNPYEDIRKWHYILNMNVVSNNQQDHDDMLAQGKAAAYFNPWKFKIERLAKGEVVFLYQSGIGIVALGEADGKLVKAPYQGNSAYPDEEYSMKLRGFQRVDPPLSDAEIKKITGINHVFVSTMFGVDFANGKAIKKFIHDHRQAKG